MTTRAVRPAASQGVISPVTLSLVHKRSNIGLRDSRCRSASRCETSRRHPDTPFCRRGLGFSATHRCSAYRRRAPCPGLHTPHLIPPTRAAASVLQALQVRPVPRRGRLNCRRCAGRGIMVLVRCQPCSGVSFSCWRGAMRQGWDSARANPAPIGIGPLAPAVLLDNTQRRLPKSGGLQWLSTSQKSAARASLRSGPRTISRPSASSRSAGSGPTYRFWRGRRDPDHRARGAGCRVQAVARRESRGRRSAGC